MAPFVREYQADAAVPGPFETRQARNMDTGETGRALSGVGEAVSNFGSTLQQRDAQNEISDISAKLSQTHSGLTDQLTNTLKSADPNDRDISDKFMQSFDDQVSSIGDSATTPQARRYFERASAQMRAHFSIQSMQGQAELQGQKAADDLQTESSNYSASLMKDPDAFDTVKNLTAASIQEKVAAGLIPAQKASEYQSKVETQYAESSLRGWITKGASQSALDQLNQGKWDDYLNGDEKYKMLAEAEQGINAERIQQDRQLELQKQAVKDANEKTATSFLSRLYDKDNPLSTQDILTSNLPAFGDNSKEQFLKLAKQTNEEKLRTDAPTYLSLAKRIGLQDGDPNKITDDGPLYEAFSNGQLTHGALMELRDERLGMKTEQGQQTAALENNFLKMASDKLTKTDPMLGIKDPEGDENYQRYLSDYYSARNAAVKGGKNVQQLLSPDSPDYIGKTLSPSLYARSAQDVVKSLYGSAPGSNAPSSAATQSPQPQPTPSPSTAAAGSGKNAPPGLSHAQFLDWWKKNGT